MTAVTEAPVERPLRAAEPPFVMHIVRRDSPTGQIIEPKIALCGKKCERELNGRPANSIMCEVCERLALQGWGASPTR